MLNSGSGCTVVIVAFGDIGAACDFGVCARDAHQSPLSDGINSCVQKRHNGAIRIEIDDVEREIFLLILQE